MKIINEKGKLFGVINIVDLLALLLIAFVIFAVAWKVFGDRIAADNEAKREQADLDSQIANRVHVTYTVRCSTLRSVYYDQLVKFGFPQQIAVNDGPVDAAYITDAYAEPTKGVAYNDDGEFIQGEYGDRVDIIVTVEADVPPNSFIKVGTQELRVGKSYIVKTQFWEISGIIETIDCDTQPFIAAGQQEVVIPELED